MYEPIDCDHPTGEIRTAVNFVLEQHLGHRTYSDNLRSALESRRDLDANWVPINYLGPPMSAFDRLPMPASLRSMANGRQEVRAGLRNRRSAVNVFNTQVPAALGGRLARSAPYIVITDVTPIQYDEMAAGYSHRVDRAGPVRWWKRRVNQKVFAEAAWCVGWSSWAASSMIDDYGADPARVAVIPPGVDLEKWKPAERSPDDAFRILFVGADFDRKGGGFLLRAFESLSSNAELWIVTKSAVRSGARVHVISDLEPNDPRLVELFRTSDVFVLPSLAETFGIAAVEASAVGLPVIASRVGGLCDIVVEEKTGLLVPPGDVTALGEALGVLETNSALRLRCGLDGRQHALEHFDAAVNAMRLADLVQSVAGA